MKILQYSGGIDSLAVLFLLKEHWPELTVLWCNPGAAYPETIEYMDRIRVLVPNFVEAKGNVVEWRKSHGYGVDVVPERHTMVGSVLYEDPPPVVYTSFLSCCGANLWYPMQEASKALGATTIYRGQKNADDLKAPIRSGHVADGVTYIFPIEDWSRKDVEKYCREVAADYIPDYYARGEVSSHDCWDCIAYLDHNTQRYKNLPDQKQRIVLDRLYAYRETLKQETAALEEIIWHSQKRN